MNLRDRFRRRTASPPVPPAPPEPPPEEILDRLIARLGFDTSRPSWSDALRQFHKQSRKRRLQIVPDFFYSPVFSPADLDPAVWEGTFPDCGDFSLERQRAFLEETPAFLDELGALPLDPVADAAVYHWRNDQFAHFDAALYYALLRRFRPRRIVEVGCGHSTKIALRALRDNGSGQILCIDPYPPPWLEALPGPIEILRKPVQSVPDAIFLDLAPSDILFIDDSHISKTGSDVNHLFLRILPRLPAGVIVQVHDICLPFEYLRFWSEDILCYWNEQYVLAALLANSTKFEILVGAYFLYRKDPELLRRLTPKLPGVEPIGGSLWLRVRD